MIAYFEKGSSFHLVGTSQVGQNTNSTILRQLIIRYDDSVCDPQTHLYTINDLSGVGVGVVVGVGVYHK